MRDKGSGVGSASKEKDITSRAEKMIREGNGNTARISQQVGQEGNRTTTSSNINNTLTLIKVKLYMSKSPNMKAIPIQTTLDNSIHLMRKFRTLEQIVVRNSMLSDANLLLPLLDSVQCSQIVQLHLVAADLSQFPSQLVSRLGELTYLNLSNNAIAEIPDHIDQVIVSRKLTSLDLSCNRLTTLPGSLSILFDRGLQNLDVQENFIELDQIHDSLKQHSQGIRKKWHNQHVAQQVIDRVYLGSIHAAKNRQFLSEKDITHILSVNHMNPPYPNEFKYKVVREYDQPTSNLLQHLEDCFSFIDSALEQPRGSVLIHCAAGQSRSATIIIAYVMYKMRVSFDEAYQIVFHKRCCIAPNQGFLNQLRLFSNIGMQYSGETYQSHIDKTIVDSVGCSNLNLQYYRLQEIPSSVCIHQWKNINLSYNNLANIETLVSCSTELLNLNLAHNLLTHLPDNVITCFHKLQTLDISFNSIREIPIDFFQCTPSLKHFNASHNQIGNIPEEIGEWSDHIEVLDMSFNHLTSLPSSTTSLLALRMFILKNNCFVQEPSVLHELRRSAKQDQLSIQFLATSQTNTEDSTINP